MERSGSSAKAIKPVRLDRKSMTVLDRQLSIALKREQSAKRLQQQQSGGRPAKEQPEGKGAVEGAEEEEVKHHWRRRLLHFLHIRWVHTTMTALLILDLITVVTSLELQIQSSQKKGQAKSICLHEYETGHAMPTYMENNTTCNPDGLHACDYTEQEPYHMAHTLHSAELGLAYTSIAILSTFLLENLAMVAALGWNFFRHFFFVLDIVVVAVSLALEIVAVASAHLELTVGNILIVARMWRFFRVAHGIYFLEHSEEAAHEVDDKDAGDSMGKKQSQVENGTTV